MGIWAWITLLVWPAALATAARYSFFRYDRGPRDFDWVYIAGGAILGGYAAHAWYPGFGPVVDGLYLIQALVGGVVGGIAMELVYRGFLSKRLAA